MQLQKKGIFTSLKKQTHQLSPEKKLNNISNKWNFCCQQTFKTDKGEASKSPTKQKIENMPLQVPNFFESNIKTEKQGLFSFSPPKFIVSSSTNAPVNSFSPYSMSYPHPSAIKTIVKAPVPIINPVIIDSENYDESERLELQIEMLLEQYRYVYQLYEDLIKKPILQPFESKPKEQSKQDKYRKLQIKKTQLVGMFDHFQEQLNCSIDKTIDKRIKQGEQSIENISSSSFKIYQQAKQHMRFL